MNKSTITREKIFSEQEIPEYIFSHKLSEENRERLMYGLKSTLLENIHLEDGTVRDGKVSFFRDKNDEIQVSVDFKQEKLIIPKKILNHTLTDQERNDLMNNKVVPLKISNKNNIFLKIDNELNKVVVSTDREIGLPPVVGEYKLTEKDLKALSNKEMLSARVYKGAHGYFMANLKVLEDGKGIEFSNIKDVPLHQVKEMIEKYNYPEPSKTIENVASVGETIINRSVENKLEDPIAKKNEPVNVKAVDPDKSKTVENIASVGNTVINDELVKKLEDAIKRKDLKEIRDICEKNPANEKSIDVVSKNDKLTREEKTTILVAMKVDPDKYLNKALSDISKDAKKIDLPDKKKINTQSVGLPKRNRGNQIQM